MWKFYRVMGTIAAVCLGLGILALIIFSGFGGWDMVRNRNWDWNFNFNQGYSYETENLEKTFEGDIKSLDISIPYGKVTFLEGDNFSFKAENVRKNSFEKLEISDSTLIIKQKRNHRLFNWGSDNDYPEITITVPKGFAADEFSYAIGAGKSDLSGVNAKNVSLEMGAGDVLAKNLQADKIKISAGAGRLEIVNGKLNDMNLDCGVGEIIIGGTITGNNKINAGVGSLKINIDGDIDDYNFDIDKGIGRITINGEEYERKHTVDAKNSFDIDGGVGEINIQINQNKGKEGLA
ncbi:MAG: DUF4097 domain-containing protein [Oscillospiraceae bacterium]|nr:DUF4097 domain-containing protein [Oscillospiraceae bacterium]